MTWRLGKKMGKWDCEWQKEEDGKKVVKSKIKGRLVESNQCFRNEIQDQGAAAI